MEFTIVNIAVERGLYSLQQAFGEEVIGSQGKSGISPEKNFKRLKESGGTRPAFFDLCQVVAITHSLGADREKGFHGLHE